MASRLPRRRGQPPAPGPHASHTRRGHSRGTCKKAKALLIFPALNFRGPTVSGIALCQRPTALFNNSRSLHFFLAILPVMEIWFIAMGISTMAFNLNGFNSPWTRTLPVTLASSSPDAAAKPRA
jgi:hypothetical protein